MLFAFHPKKMYVWRLFGTPIRSERIFPGGPEDTWADSPNLKLKAKLAPASRTRLTGRHATRTRRTKTWWNCDKCYPQDVMALRSLANRLPAPLRQRAYSLTPGGAAFRRRLAQNRGASTNAKPVVSAKVAVGAGVLTGGLVAGQYFFGSADNFYDHRFITKADPDAMAEFYGNEDFMEIFCVFPFMVDFMMRSGYFDDNGHVHTFGLPPIVSNMVVSMQFDEREEEDEDGEAHTVCFNKKERFKCSAAIFGWTLWEMVQNFGYAQRDDGTSEVYHYGQSWRGPFFIRLIFQTHARYVIYATEQHLNSPRFLAQDEDEEDDLVAQRHNIPKHLLGQFLDGLEVDVQAKLGESAKALATLGQAPKDDAELAALKAQVASLESTLRDLREASLRRQQTAAAAPKRALRRATTALERRDTGVESKRRPKPEGSAKGFYDRVLQRRATRAEEAAAAADNAAATAAITAAAAKQPGLHETIAAALEHAEDLSPEEADSAGELKTRIQRRVTAIEESAED